MVFQKPLNKFRFIANIKGRSPFNGKLSDFSSYIDSHIISSPEV